MAWKWIADDRAIRNMKRLPRYVNDRIVKKLDFWVGSGTPLSFADTLSNFELGSYRFRVGNYRIAFDVEDETIVVLAVGHRREIYK